MRKTAALEVPGDRQRTAVEALGGELGAQRHDALTDRLGRALRATTRAAGARLDGLEAAFAIPTQEPVQVPAADAGLGCGSGDGRLVRDDLQDGDPMLRHAPDCHRCPDSAVTYHVSPMS